MIALQLLLPARAQLPSMGDGADMTLAAERVLGDQIARELYRDPDYMDDPVIAEYVQDIWQRLLAASRSLGYLTPEMDRTFAWQVLLGRDAEVNAFALPGGYMGVQLGIITIVDSRDELAAVLGHELSHITQRHIARGMERDAKMTPVMIAAMALGILAAAKSHSGDAAAAVVTGSQSYAMNKALAYSRDNEREADRFGFAVMTRAGYAPQGAALMFEKLQRASRLNDNGSYPYLRTHPLTSERMADMQQRIQLKPGADAALPLMMDHAMVRARARVLTRPGFDLLRQWMHAPDVAEFAKAQAAEQAGTLYAAALSAKEMRDYKTARAMAERLAARTEGNPAAARLARLLGAEIELAAGDPAAASARLNPQAKDRPELLLTTQAAVAQHDAARLPLLATALRNWTAAHPRDATAWQALSGVYGLQNEPVRAIHAEAEADVAILDYPAARDRLKAAQDLMRQGRTGPADYYEASIIDARERQVEQLVKQQAAEPPLK